MMLQVGMAGFGCGFSQAKPVIAMIAGTQYSTFRCWNLTEDPHLKTSGFQCSDGIDKASEGPIFKNNLAVPSAESDPSDTHFFTMTENSLYKSDFSIVDS